MKNIIDIINEAIVKKPRTTEYKSSNTIDVYETEQELQYIIVWTYDELKKIVNIIKPRFNVCALANNNRIKNIFSVNAVIGIRPNCRHGISFKGFITDNTDINAPFIKLLNNKTNINTLHKIKTYDIDWLTLQNWERAGYELAI